MLCTLLLGVLAVPEQAPGVGPASAVVGAVDYAEPAQREAAKAELEQLRQQPFNPRQLARQFAHGIDSMLPHGQRTAPATDEYWTDPVTKLVHHRLPHLTEQQFQGLVDVTRQFAGTAVAYSLSEVTGYTGEAPPMRIDVGDTQRIFAPPRRNYSPAELDIMERKVEELSAAGHVKHIPSSNFACNVVLAAKRAPDGTWSDQRFCVNFIPVNKHTVLDNYGSHKADALLQHAARKRYLTALDLRSGFHQIHMHPDDVCKTAFWYVRKALPPILMAYTRMPFGLKNASAKFQRVMDFELQKHGLTEFAFAYIDDLIIASDTWEEHVEHVRRVLQMLQSCGLKIHPSKSIFGSDVLEYLGHNVLAGKGITMNEAKVAALKSLPTPTNLLELRSVLGFMSYYRHFIPGFSSLVEPLVQLLRKDVPFVWGADQQQAYASLRELMSRPGLVLRPVDPNRELILHTDWSTRGIGAVLGQLDDEGREYLCGCISRSLNKHERNYPAYKGELLALTWAVQSFRTNLHGVRFKLVTDHRPLTWLMSARDLNGQYARWQMMLQEYDFVVQHRPGLQHQNADALSRFPDPHTRDGSTGTQLDPEEHIESGERPGLCLAMRAAPAAVHSAEQRDSIDAFCPSFGALLGAGSAHPDPVYYAHQVMQERPRLAADEDESAPPAPAADPTGQPGPPPSAARRAAPGEPDVSASLEPLPPGLSEAELEPVGEGVVHVPGTAVYLRPQQVYDDDLPASLLCMIRGSAYVRIPPPAAVVAAASARTHEAAEQELGDVTPVIARMRESARACTMRSMLESKQVIREAAASAARILDQPVTHELVDNPDPVLDRRPVSHSFWHAAQDRGITVVELCAGICTGLEAVLLSGIRVNAYLYCDIDADARRVAEFRLHNLSARFPDLLPPTAIADAFSVPQDVRSLHSHHITSHPLVRRDSQLLFFAGWPCQDYSAAGRGRVGQRAALLHHVLRIVTAFQWPGQRWPPAYFFENVATQHNFNHPHIRHVVTQELQQQLGEPVELDAAQAGSYASRLRNYWTNLADHRVLQVAVWLAAVWHDGDLYDVLREHRHPMPVLRRDRAGNEPGQPRRLWPTLVAYHQSRAFVPGGAGCVYDEQADSIGEPCAEERELAMGFEPSCTAAPGVSDGTRCALLGQAIDLNALFMLIQCAQQLQELQVAAPAQSKRRHERALAHSKPLPRLASMAPIACPAQEQQLVERAARDASSDIWLDLPVLHHLQTGSTAGLTTRGTRRAKSYVWFNNRLYRVLRDEYTGQVTHRMVPEPAKRDQLILECHVALGHLGEKRTIAAMAQTYWWYGLTVDVRRVLSGCKLCARVHASAGENPRNMITEPASQYGMFHRWGLDYVQDLPASASGNKHCLIIIDYYSKWVEAIPTSDLLSGTTARLFHLHICARFGMPAEVITDGGSAFRGDFHELCVRKLIHHRIISEDLPRSNGLAERAVQTIKAALRKHVADKHNALTWDTEALPNILLGYRCTPQAATGHSPARILFALDPVLDAEQYLLSRTPIDYTADVPVEQLGMELLARAQLAAEVGASVVHNIRTAHERDCRRFRARRSGLYVPRIHHFNVGDYVFVLAQGQKPGGTLGIRARNEVLRVQEVRDSGVLVLQNQAGRTLEKHFEHCVPCMLPNLLGDTYAGLVKPQADLPCQVCHDHNHFASMLLCDNCDTGWHTYCLDPPLEDIPEGSWLCPDCLKCGVTFESLAAKQQRYVAEPESRPALELPSRRRVARARQYASQWHGKAVSHTKAGRTRYGRIQFQGILHSKWFAIHWADGTMTEHNASILRHLCVVDDPAAAAQLPPVPPAVVLTAQALEPPEWGPLATPWEVQHAITQATGWECPPFHALDVLCAINKAYARAPMDWERRNTDELLAGLRAVLPLELLGSCFLPLSEGHLLPELLKVGLPCFDNHPSRLAKTSLHLDPFQPRTYQRVADAGFADTIWLVGDPLLLDLLLPLAFSQARMLVVAAVPTRWLSERQLHRVLWLHDEVWGRSLGLVVHIHQADGALPEASCSWLLLFSSQAHRERLLGGRVPNVCSECVWRSDMPQQLHFLSSLPSMHQRIFRRLLTCMSDLRADSAWGGSDSPVNQFF